LVFADESLYLSDGVQLQDPNYQNMVEYREGLFEHICDDKRVWAGLKPYPWFEFGILVERQQGGTTSGVRPRKTESRLATGGSSTGNARSGTTEIVFGVLGDL
jgi:hypothetical protein